MPYSRVYDPEASVFSVLWQDSSTITLDEPNLQVNFNNSCCGTAKFDSEGDFLFFKMKFGSLEAILGKPRSGRAGLGDRKFKIPKE